MLRAFSRALVPALLFAGSVSAADGPVIKFTDVKLKNGLRVILSEDHSAPTFSIAVTYNVGSADEKARRTGFGKTASHQTLSGKVFSDFFIQSVECLSLLRLLGQVL